MKEQLKVVVCGLGQMGRRHLRVLKGLPGCRVVAVVDLIPQLADVVAAETGCAAGSNLKEALLKHQPDCVFVTASTDAHHALATIVLKRGIALFLEKPITATSAEGASLVKLAKGKGTPFMVGHVERFNPAVRTAKRLIEEGRLGEIIHLSIKRVGGSPKDLERAGDVLIDLAVHDVDLARWLLKESPELIATAGHRRNVLDSATLLLTTGKTSIDIHTNWLTPVKIRQIQITGSEGFLDMDLISQKVSLTLQNPTLKKRESEEALSFTGFLRCFLAPEQTEIRSPFCEPLEEEIKAFLQCLTDKKEVPVTGQEALEALQIVEKARQLLDRDRPRRKARR